LEPLSVILGLVDPVIVVDRICADVEDAQHFISCADGAVDQLGEKQNVVFPG
jgi:hypothetical protein